MPVKVKLTKTRKKRATRVKKAPVTEKEVGRLGAALRALGAAGGSMLGGYIGHPLAGGAAGSSLGAALSRWLGAGDYRVGTNSIVQRSLKSADSIPMMHNEAQSVVIRHREYLGEIRGNTSFSIEQSYQINPGNSKTFPWLAGVAVRFQEYRIKGMVYHYIPSSGSAVSGTNAALGTVMLSTSYRSTDSPPASKVEMLNEYCSNEAVPSEAFCHPIECDPKENPFNIQYVRSGDVPAEDSRLLYDLGVTHVATSGQQDNGKVLGDLWVTYDIELKKPIVASNVTSTTKSTEVYFSAGTMTGSNWFNGTAQYDGTLGATASGRVITFPSGTVGDFLIVVRLISTTNYTAVGSFGVSTFTDCANIRIAPGGSLYAGTILGGTATLGSAFYVTAVRISDPAVSATVTVPSISITGASTETQLMIAPINTSV